MPVSSRPTRATWEAKYPAPWPMRRHAPPTCIAFRGRPPLAEPTQSGAQKRLWDTSAPLGQRTARARAPTTWAQRESTTHESRRPRQGGPTAAAATSERRASKPPRRNLATTKAAARPHEPGSHEPGSHRHATDGADSITHATGPVADSRGPDTNATKPPSGTRECMALEDRHAAHEDLRLVKSLILI